MLLGMGIHHVALACRDLEATHRFYTEACGFELVKAQVAPTDKPGAWAKHVFYDTGPAGLNSPDPSGQPGPMIAFWELHDDRMTELPTAISTGLGYEAWVNHLAFSATSVDDMVARRERWMDHGHDVVQIDHGFCQSIYTNDPNDIVVEFCVDVVPYTEEDRRAALAALTTTGPGSEPAPVPEFFLARRPAPSPTS